MGANVHVPIAVAVETPTSPFKPGDVMIGSKIFAFFLSIFMIGDSSAAVTGDQNWMLSKLREGQSTGDLPPANSAGSNGIRRQIIHMEKGLVGSGDGTPMAFKGVIKVPRGMQTMRQGDQWIITFFNNDGTQTVSQCVRAIYKSFQ